ncbi:hypothetical protein TrCOL_g2212 [Triparma columacea]|uniref:Uncharacterized protein n=1 Tax=Triparma columacea TaxID=722753 RepID=A0A9W7G257_9STRA|nr:hypothetical protein TrCOL_g2212 [Triparma columacea]
MKMSSLPSMVKKIQDNTELVIEFYRILASTRGTPASEPVCDVALAAMTGRDLTILVGALNYMLKYEANEEDAVARFVETHEAMKDLNAAYPSFEKSLQEQSKRLLADKQKWAKVKLFVAAALSMGDLFTDIMMVIQFFGMQEPGFAWATLASILANLVFQAILVHFQNRTLPLRTRIWEQVYVWTLVKPGVDAWRVASGTEHEVGKMYDPYLEMATIKLLEIVAESIPGALIQLSAILRAGSKTTSAALFSFVFCIFATAFTSTMVSYDFDISQSNRKHSPFYYGYTPRNLIGKAKVFLSLFALASFNLLVRTYACILFYMEGGFTGISIVLCAELLLYILVKALRRDLWYWAPVYGFSGYVITAATRVLIKIVVDWTALVQLRHPNEVGGAYFTFSIFVTITGGIIAALGYEKKAVEEVLGGDEIINHGNESVVEEVLEGDEINRGNEGVGMEESTVVTTMVIACVGTILSFGTLLLSMNKEYVHTFIGTKTSDKVIQEKFTDFEEDAIRFQVLANNRYKWEYKIGPQVKSWLDERLPVWLEDEPEWFDDLCKSQIPDDFVSDPAILVRLRTNNVKAILEERRRSSVLGILTSSAAVHDEVVNSGGSVEEQQEAKE